MGSTRQIFSEDRPSPGLLPDRMDQHTGDSSDYQILGMMKFKTNKEDIWRFGHIGHIGQSWNLESFKILHKIGLQNCCIGWKLGRILLQLFLISLQQRLSVVVFQTTTVFFILLKSYGILICEFQPLSLVKSILSYPVKETPTLSSFI